jgi:hypothetical protein
MTVDRWIALALAAVVVVLLVLRFVARSRERAEHLRPQRDALDTVMAWRPEVTRVLTQHERQAWRTLVQAFPEHVILAQVPLQRFLKVPKRHSYGEWLHRVGRLTADLLVCDAATQVLAVVEVHSPRDSDRSKQRHDRLSRVLKEAGVRLVVWIENAIPPVDTARATVLPLPPVAEGAAPSRPAQPTPMPTPAASRPASAPLPVPEAEEVHLDTRPMSEPTPSTWFDDFDSSPTPLDPPRRR